MSFRQKVSELLITDIKEARRRRRKRPRGFPGSLRRKRRTKPRASREALGRRRTKPRGFPGSLRREEGGLWAGYYPPTTLGYVPPSLYTLPVHPRRCTQPSCTCRLHHARH